MEPRFLTERSGAEPASDDVAARALETWSHAESDTTRWLPPEDEPTAAPTVEYRVERLDRVVRPSINMAEGLEAYLGARAAEGWRLRTVLPAGTNGQLAIFEREADPDDVVAVMPAPEAPQLPSPRRAAGEWESARSRFAAERAEQLLANQARPPRGGVRPLPRPGDGRRRRTAAVAAALALLAVVLVAGLGTLGGDSAAPPDEDRAVAGDGAGAGAAKAASAASAPEVPACRDVPAAAESRAAVRCRTAGRVLTIAGPGISAEAAGTKTRVLGVERQPGAIVVRVGVRNRGNRAFDVQDVPGRAVLSVGGVRLGPAAPVPSTVVRPGRAIETELRFATSTASDAALGRSAGRADLGLSDDASRSRARRATVLRLRIPAEQR